MTKNRLETFSDSVMAIVVTLLALELKIPISGSMENGEAILHINELAPEFFIFVLSFITISIMWINHHYITNKIEEVTHKTVWANTMLLLFVTMIPFATSFLGQNPENQVALIMYSVVMLLASISFTWLKYSSIPRNMLTHEKEFFRHVGIYFYTLAIFVAFVVPPLTYFVLLVPPFSYILPGKK